MALTNEQVTSRRAIKLSPDDRRAADPIRPSSRAGRLADLAAQLKSAGLRPTRQRLAIAEQLFRSQHRHVSADDLHRDMLSCGTGLSLATVYNALNKFADVGLLRRVAVEGGRAYFDTDAGDHQHFYIEDENRIIDIAPGLLRLGKLPTPPPGYRIIHVDITIRLKRTDTVNAARKP